MAAEDIVDGSPLSAKEATLGVGVAVGQPLCRPTIIVARVVRQEAMQVLWALSCLRIEVVGKATQASGTPFSNRGSGEVAGDVEPDPLRGSTCG